MLYIDRTACTGCGMCVDVCHTGAISLDNIEGVSTIDATLCDECLACLDACLNDAIRFGTSPDLVPVTDYEVVEGEVIRREAIPVPAPEPWPVPRPSGHLAALAGTALTTMGSWLLPRAADALVAAVERRLVGGTDSAPSSTPRRSGSNLPASQTGSGAGGRRARQRRRRRQRQ